MNKRPARPEAGQLLKDYDWGKLYDYICSLELNGDGRTCRVSRTAKSTSISVIFPPAPSPVKVGSGSIYNGYFAAADASTEEDGFQIAVIDGAYGDIDDALLMPAGRAVINDILLDVDSGIVAVSPGDEFIYIEFAIGESYVPGQELTADDISIELKSSDEFPAPEVNMLKYVTHTIEVDADGIQNITQQQHGAIYAAFFSTCPDESSSSSGGN